MERALEFDQSQLFAKIYSDEFGMPGGEPYGLLIGDYQIHARPIPGHFVDDMAVLGRISETAAAAFVPFVASAHPSLFGLDQFADLERPLDLTYTFRQAELARWRSLREKDESRFLGLVLPRVLVRLPYADNGLRRDGFRFAEDVSTSDGSGYLWGNAAYSFAAVVLRAFIESGWLADIRGVQTDVDGGGLVDDLPVPALATDAPGLLSCPGTDVIISDDQEKELTDLGFIPLCYCRATACSAFYSNQSVQAPVQYEQLPARINARLSAMLQYILCASRFAHYLKVMARDMVGSSLSASDVQWRLQSWLVNYVSGDPGATSAMKARYPLSEGRVEVRDHPGKPGSYLSTFYLKPHYQLDELVASFRLITELSSTHAAGGAR
jgi:type VI secretion system ImpC/EvpB family protein